MNNLKDNKKVIGICIILILLSILIYLFNNRNNDVVDNLEKEAFVLENYGANEFIPVYITEFEMAEKYLNDYKYKILYSRDEAYQLLNEEYRDEKFLNYEEFNKYIDNLITLSTYSMKMEKYSITSIGGYKYYSIFDTSGNQFIFKELSIMNYEVFFDDDTIEIR